MNATVTDGPLFRMTQPMQKMVRKNWITEDEYKLISERRRFALDITKEEHIKAKCNHIMMDGMGDALEYDPSDHTVVCKVCGERFKPVSTSDNTYVEESINEVVNILETIKIIFVDFPEDAADTFFDIIPMIKKVPIVWNLACKNLAKHETYSAVYGYQGASQSAMGLLNYFVGMMDRNEMTVDRKNRKEEEKEIYVDDVFVYNLGQEIYYNLKSRYPDFYGLYFCENYKKFDGYVFMVLADPDISIADDQMSAIKYNGHRYFMSDNMKEYLNMNYGKTGTILARTAIQAEIGDNIKNIGSIGLISAIQRTGEFMSSKNSTIKTDIKLPRFIIGA